MFYNLFQFVSLFLLSTELPVSIHELLLIKKVNVDFENKKLTVNHVTYTISEETTVSLLNLVNFDKQENDLLFLRAK